MPGLFVGAGVLFNPNEVAAAPPNPPVDGPAGVIISAPQAKGFAIVVGAGVAAAG
jgi:hypothetical protein